MNARCLFVLPEVNEELTSRRSRLWSSPSTDKTLGRILTVEGISGTIR